MYRRAVTWVGLGPVTQPKCDVIALILSLDPFFFTYNNKFILLTILNKG